MGIRFLKIAAVYNLALPVMMVALAFLLSGHAQALYFLEPASTLMVLGLLIFVANVCLNVRTAGEQGATQSPRSTGRPMTAGVTAR